MDISVQSCDIEQGHAWLKKAQEELTLAKQKLAHEEEMQRKIEVSRQAHPSPLGMGLDILPDDWDTLKLARNHLETVERRLSYGAPTTYTVIACECKPRKFRAKLRARIEQFNIVQNEGHLDFEMTFSSWKTRAGTKEALQAAREFASGQCSWSILVLSGTYGSGKTHLLSAIVNEYTVRFQRARYRYVPSLLQELRSTFGKNYDGDSLEDLLESYGGVGLLGLDDLGAGKENPSPWSVEQLEILVNARYENGMPLVVTTNLDIRALAERWSPRIAERLFDRRTGKVKQVLITAASYRTGETW